MTHKNRCLFFVTHKLCVYGVFQQKYDLFAKSLWLTSRCLRNYDSQGLSLRSLWLTKLLYAVLHCESRVVHAFCDSWEMCAIEFAICRGVLTLKWFWICFRTEIATTFLRIPEPTFDFGRLELPKTNRMMSASRYRFQNVNWIYKNRLKSILEFLFFENVFCRTCLFIATPILPTPICGFPIAGWFSPGCISSCLLAG